MHTADVVQVQLVGGSWLGVAIPVLALLVSLATLGWTVWMRERDRARIRVVMTSFHFLGRPGGPFIAFEATNVGHTGSTVVTGFHFRAPKNAADDDKRYLHVPESAVPFVSLPKTLHPGESATWVTFPGTIAAECWELGVGPRDLVPFCATGHRNFKGTWKRSALELVEQKLADARRQKAAKEVDGA